MPWVPRAGRRAAPAEGLGLAMSGLLKVRVALHIIHFLSVAFLRQADGAGCGLPAESRRSTWTLWISVYRTGVHGPSQTFSGADLCKTQPRPLPMGGPKDHINIRISHPGSRAQYRGNTRNHGLYDPFLFMMSFGPLSKDTGEVTGAAFRPRFWGTSLAQDLADAIGRVIGLHSPYLDDWETYSKST